MPVEFRIESVEWERVNLTFNLKLGRTDVDGSSWEPIEAAVADADRHDVVHPLSDEDWRTDTFESTSEQDGVVALEDVDAGPGGADSPDAIRPADGDDVVVVAERALGSVELADGGASFPALDSIYIRDVSKGYTLVWSSLGEGRFRVHVNISNFRARAFLPTGTWKFFAKLDSGEVVGGTWELSRLEELDSLSRVFLYSGNKQVYTVSFGLTEDDVAPLFALRAYSFVRKPARGPKRPRSAVGRMRKVVKRAVAASRRRQLAQAIYNRTAQEERALRAKLGHSETRPRVLFASEMREGIEGNLLAVRDRLVERGLDSQLDIHYSFRTGRTSTRNNYLSLVRELARADIVLIDDYFPPFENLKLGSGKRVIQVWHAGSGFKSVGFSRFGKFGSPALTNAHRTYTYAITASHGLKHVYAEVFGIEEEAVIPTGLPRIDTFLNPSHQITARADVYSRFPALEGKRVIMFAPTFRGRGASHAHYNYAQIDFQALYDLCGDDTLVAFRMHHFVHQPVPIPESMRDRFIDVSDYRDGNALLLVTDLLITDYSSIIFEYSLLRRPMLFFAYDEEVYSSVRGFHRPYRETAPGKVCNTFEQLMDAIRTQDFELERGEAFRAENFDVIDMNSSDRVIDWLILGDPPQSAVLSAPQTTNDAAGEPPALPTANVEGAAK